MTYLYRYLQAVFTQLGMFGSAYMLVDAYRGSTISQYGIYVAVISSLGVPFFYYLFAGKKLPPQENRCIHDVHGTDCYQCFETWVENRSNELGGF